MNRSIDLYRFKGRRQYTSVSGLTNGKKQVRIGDYTCGGAALAEQNLDG
jgi:hypothetical protein